MDRRGCRALIWLDVIGPGRPIRIALDRVAQFGSRCAPAMLLHGTASLQAVRPFDFRVRAIVSTSSVYSTPPWALLLHRCGVEVTLGWWWSQKATDATKIENCPLWKPRVARFIDKPASVRLKSRVI